MNAATPQIYISVQEADFDAGAIIRQLGACGGGAVASFVGLVRADEVSAGGVIADEVDTQTANAQGTSNCVSTLTLEHYPGMTERSLHAIAQQVAQRWPLLAITVIHRIGKLHAGEQIVLVGIAARHRGDAFAACECLMDYLKTEAPFWKKEQTAQGERWVEHRASDDDAVKRWDA